MRFSVLIPTKDRGDLLLCALETVRRQDFSDWEVIISDNASSVDVQSLLSEFPDPRIKVVRQRSPVSVTDNWNSALAMATGDYVVMLGDDDGLLPGYFATLHSLIEDFGYPEMVYTGALLFAPPSVHPGRPEGFVKSYRSREIYAGREEAFLLSEANAQKLVAAAFDFRVKYDFNMQFALLKADFITRLQRGGPLYSSPYPDYFAMNLCMFQASSVLVIPKPIVAIGISAKSFGFYYFNGRESDGHAFLANPNEPVSPNFPQEFVMPGSEMNTQWLTALNQLADRLPLKPNLSRYWELQARHILAQAVNKAMGSRYKLDDVPASLKTRSMLWLSRAAKTFRLVPRRLRSVLASWIIGGGDSHPKVNMPDVLAPATNVTAIFDKVEALNSRDGWPPN